MMSGIGRASKGFTLIEVLVAFAILATCLIPIAAEFGRHLTLLKILEDSLVARRLADQVFIQHVLRDEIQDAVLQEPERGFTPHWELDDKYRLSTEPVKDLVIDRAQATVSWDFRGNTYSEKLVSGFMHKKSEEPPL